jgi:hypothetical protein
LNNWRDSRVFDPERVKEEGERAKVLRVFEV